MANILKNSQKAESSDFSFEVTTKCKLSVNLTKVYSCISKSVNFVYDVYSFTRRGVNFTEVDSWFTVPIRLLCVTS